MQGDDIMLVCNNNKNRTRSFIVKMFFKSMTVLFAFYGFTLYPMNIKRFAAKNVAKFNKKFYSTNIKEVISCPWLTDKNVSLQALIVRSDLIHTQGMSEYTKSSYDEKFSIREVAAQNTLVAQNNIKETKKWIAFYGVGTTMCAVGVIVSMPHLAIDNTITNVLCGANGFFALVSAYAGDDAVSEYKAYKKIIQFNYDIQNYDDRAIEK